VSLIKEHNTTALCETCAVRLTVAAPATAGQTEAHKLIEISRDVCAASKLLSLATYAAPKRTTKRVGSCEPFRPALMEFDVGGKPLATLQRLKSSADTEVRLPVPGLSCNKIDHERHLRLRRKTKRRAKGTRSKRTTGT
jgi:hypothetical protein